MIWLWKFCLYFIIICKSNLQIRNFLWCFFVYNHDHLALLKHKLLAPALNSYDLLEPTNHIHDAIKLFAPFSINQTLPNSVTSIAQLPHTHTCIYDTRGHTFSAFSKPLGLGLDVWIIYGGVVRNAFFRWLTETAAAVCLCRVSDGTSKVSPGIMNIQRSIGLGPAGFFGSSFADEDESHVYVWWDFLGDNREN